MNIKNTELYRGADNRYYQILSLDSDTVLMTNASVNRFSVGTRPFLDNVQNIIDFSDVYHFGSIKDAKDFRIKTNEILTRVDDVEAVPAFIGENNQKNTATLSFKKEKSI